MKEVTATFEVERFRFENAEADTVIAVVSHVDGEKPDSVNGEFSVVGPDSSFEPGQPYRFFGHWSKYTNRRTGDVEDQFKFKSAVPAQPHGRQGIIRYLSSIGAGCRFGPVAAERLWSAWGADAVRKLREEPAAAVADIPRVTVESAETIAERLWERYHTENCSIELLSLLEKRGFPKATEKRAIKIWGNAAPDVIKRDPYKMMRFKGCGFVSCDKMYRDLGLNATRMKRQALAAWYRIASDSTGHTWYPPHFAVRGVQEWIGPAADPAAALRLAKRAEILDTLRIDGDRIVDAGGQLWIAETKDAQAERFVARSLVDAEDEPVLWPDPDAIGEHQPNISDHQIEQLELATKGVIGVFGGSPGTGKSFSAAGLIGAIGDEFGMTNVACAAPTGKAAVRMTEALASGGIHLTAKTIHSLLRVESAEDGGWNFHYRQGNPLPYKFVIVDETSMVDVALMASLLAARGTGTHILFVGDVNQLPPVGHGAPLRDMISAGVPYGELREIQRNSGRIVQACAEMRDAKQFEVSDHIDLDAGENLYCTGGGSDEEILTTLDGLFDLAIQMGFDPVWETQVVVPVNKKSKLCRKSLNERLQQLLNNEPGVPNQPFRAQDKVINLKNGWFSSVASIDDDTTNDRGEVYVANGEIGRVVEVAEKHFIAELDSPKRQVRVPRGKAAAKEGDDDTGTGCSWDLAYAVSVHKSQGAEWPLVIVVLDEYPGARRICDRAWVYTAVSRAKQLCLLVGRLETAHRFCRQTKIHERKTFLVETVKHEQSLRLLAEL